MGKFNIPVSGAERAGIHIMEEITIALRAIRAEEMSFKANDVKLDKDVRLDLKPSFSRRIRRAPENENFYLVSLEVKIESTETSPKPFDLKVCLTGVFESELQSDAARLSFNVQAVSILYPYLRAAVTSLTSASFVAPWVLPVIAGVLFPEDKTAENGPIS